MNSKRPTALSVWQAILSCRRCNSQFLSIDLKRFSSSKRWQSRQRSDLFTREAVVRGLKSRAAFKLLQVILAWIVLRSQEVTLDSLLIESLQQIDEQYRIFRSGQTVVDLVSSS
jgi:21S rRNA (uridine2791-2'-O)-methyltransferase